MDLSVLTVCTDAIGRETYGLGLTLQGDTYGQLKLDQFGNDLAGCDPIDVNDVSITRIVANYANYVTSFELTFDAGSKAIVGEAQRGDSRKTFNFAAGEAIVGLQGTFNSKNISSLSFITYDKACGKDSYDRQYNAWLTAKESDEAKAAAEVAEKEQAEKDAADMANMLITGAVLLVAIILIIVVVIVAKNHLKKQKEKSVVSVQVLPGAVEFKDRSDEKQKMAPSKPNIDYESPVVVKTSRGAV